jgi:hypothetical protein
MLLSPRLQILHVEYLVVHHWMVFLKTRPFTKQNNSEFTNVSSFTSFLMWGRHFTRSCRILLSSIPTSKHFFKFMYPELPGESAWRVLFRPCLCLLLWQLKSSELDSLKFWTSDFQDHPSSCRKFLYFTFLFVYLVSGTQKMCWREHSLADTVPHFLPFYSFLQNWVITEVLVCPGCALHQFILLDNSIRLLYFHVCFPVFLSCVYSFCLMDHTIIHTSLFLWNSFRCVIELIIHLLKPSNTTQEDINTSRQHVSTACSHLQSYKQVLERIASKKVPQDPRGVIVNG